MQQYRNSIFHSHTQRFQAIAEPVHPRLYIGVGESPIVAAYCDPSAPPLTDMPVYKIIRCIEHFRKIQTCCHHAISFVLLFRLMSHAIAPPWR
jgi:hypothetical protein